MAFSFLQRLFGRRDFSSGEVSEDRQDSAGAEAQFLMGVKHASSEGMARDYAQAAHWYGQAAEQNHSLAQFNLAMMYGQGQGVPRDEAKSLMWMTRAANLGDPGAQYMLGVQQHVACREGQAGATTEKRVEALKWVRLSAAQGYRGAQDACEFVSLGMTREEVVEGGRRAVSFVAEQATVAPPPA